MLEVMEAKELLAQETLMETPMLEVEMEMVTGTEMPMLMLDIMMEKETSNLNLKKKKKLFWTCTMTYSDIE